MSIKDPFNNSTHQGYNAEKVNDNVLCTYFNHNVYKQQRCYFDFVTRTVSILVASHNSDRIMLFSECEPEMLELHRQKLIALGGDPLPLSLDKPRTPGAPRQFGI